MVSYLAWVEVTDAGLTLSSWFVSQRHKQSFVRAEPTMDILNAITLLTGRTLCE